MQGRLMTFLYLYYFLSIKCVCVSDLASVEHEIMKTLRHLIIISFISCIENVYFTLSEDSVDRFTEHVTLTAQAVNGIPNIQFSVVFHSSFILHRIFTNKQGA